MTRRAHTIAEERNALVIFLESGAKLPELARNLQARYPDNVVLAESVTESAEDFSARAIRRLEQLGASGYTVRAAMLAVGEQASAAAFAARHRIATEVARFAAPHSAPDLLLVGSGGLSAAGRADLKTLAEVLSQEFGTRGPNVRLVLDSPRRPVVPANRANQFAAAHA